MVKTREIPPSGCLTVNIIYLQTLLVCSVYVLMVFLAVGLRPGVLSKVSISLDKRIRINNRITKFSSTLCWTHATHCDGVPPAVSLCTNAPAL